MDLLFYKEYVENYGLSTVIIGLIALIITQIIVKIFKDKIKKYSGFLPMALGIIFQFAYALIFLQEKINAYDVISAGLLSGSLSFAIKALVQRFTAGKSLSVDENVLVIEGILGDIVKEKDKDAVANKIAEILNGNSPEKNSEIKEIIILNKSEGASEEQINATVTLIVNSRTKTE